MHFNGGLRCPLQCLNMHFNGGVHLLEGYEGYVCDYKHSLEYGEYD